MPNPSATGGLIVWPRSVEITVRCTPLFRMFAKGKGSGIELSRDDALLAEFRDGKVVRLGYYNDQQKAREAAGLAK